MSSAALECRSSQSSPSVLCLQQNKDKTGPPKCTQMHSINRIHNQQQNRSQTAFNKTLNIRKYSRFQCCIRYVEHYANTNERGTVKAQETKSESLEAVALH